MDYRATERALDKEAFRRQRQYVRDARVVLDVGAYVGEMANGYRLLYPRATIHAFEPNLGAYRQLVAELASTDGGIRAYRLALDDTEGGGWLHVNEPARETSLLATTGRFLEREIHPVDVCRVRVTTLERFCQRQGIVYVDVLKLDVQGAEMRVLRGGRRLFAEGRVGLVFCELNFWHYYEGQAWWYEIGAWLAGYGYALRELAPQWRDGYVSHANGVFVREG